MKRIRAKKRSKVKPGRKAPKACPEPEYSLDVPVEIPDVREKIIRMVGQAAPEMVRFMVAQVKNGHYLAMKYLFEMVGLFPAMASTDAEGGESLTQTLMRNLGLLDENAVQELGLQTKVTKEKSSSADVATTHALK